MNQPSQFQLAIYSHIEDPQGGNAIVKAVAGSGKTTTLVGAANRVPSSKRAVFLAFNKSIATELAARLPSHFQARTFHSLCYSPVLRSIGARTVNPDKLREICKAHLSDAMGRMYGAFVRKLVGLARNAGIGCLVEDDSAVWEALVMQHDIQLDNDDATLEEGIEFAREVLALSNNSKEVDFDDLLYFSVLKRVRLPQFDWVFVDEAQDTNAIQREILRKILAPGGRLVAVGDPAQAIYGFRGADSDSMNLIASEFAPVKELPLSVTYRCSQEVTEFARAFTDDIRPRDGAPDGAVNDRQDDWKLQELQPEDLVVCRTTAPLIDLGWKLMRARIPLRILGRDIGDGLINLIKRCDKRGGNIEAMVARLEAWRDREVGKALAKDQEAVAETIEDKAAAVLMLAEELPESKRTVTELIRVIEGLFNGSAGCVTLSTVHKAKGLEAGTVWWLGRSLCPSRWAKQEWQQVQERNIMYVAVTRAKLTLNMIETDKTLAKAQRSSRQREAS